MSGRPFLQIPGPTLVPERSCAPCRSRHHHRAQFAALVGEILTGSGVFQAERDSDPVPARARRLGAAVVSTLSR
jgi:hypothetical protein